MKISVAVGALLLMPLFAHAADEVRGDYYDWLRTLAPEAPWRHDYSRTLVMKIFLCSRDRDGNVENVRLTFGDALRVIKELDNVTFEVPKIVYLVGWQFTGHDSGYPAWNVVNERLKRPGETALESLRWLMRAARQYHTVVSLHINMFDAYENSPLWRTYVDNNVILKDGRGAPIKSGLYGGMAAYAVSYAQEWKLGLTQQRIEALLQMVPELKEAGTIHIDAFHSIQPGRTHDRFSSPYLKLTVSDEIAAQRKIIRYWRSQGIDVTIETPVSELQPDPFIGLVPFGWHYYDEDLQRLDWLGKPPHFKSLPPSLYAGTPMPAEKEIEKDPWHLNELLREFCDRVLPWYNGKTPRPQEQASEFKSNVLLPASWRPNTLVACSEKGYTSRSWPLPASWETGSSVRLTRITLNGHEPKGFTPITHHGITLSLDPGEAVALEPR